MNPQTKGPCQGLMIPRSSHIPGVTYVGLRGGGGGGVITQNTWTIDLNQTTDNVLSQIKDNCYELHWLYNSQTLLLYQATCLGPLDDLVGCNVVEKYTHLLTFQSSCSPGNMTCSPGHFTCSPENFICSPENLTCSPENFICSPQKFYLLSRKMQ